MIFVRSFTTASKQLTWTAPLSMKYMLSPTSPARLLGHNDGSKDAYQLESHTFQPEPSAIGVLKQFLAKPLHLRHYKSEWVWTNNVIHTNALEYSQLPNKQEGTMGTELLALPTTKDKICMIYACSRVVEAVSSFIIQGWLRHCKLGLQLLRHVHTAPEPCLTCLRDSRQSSSKPCPTKRCEGNIKDVATKSTFAWSDTESQYGDRK